MKKDVATRLRGFVDSTDRSFLAGTFRTACLPISVLYSLAAKIHHSLYDFGIRKTTRVPCVVISVGNLTMGGVGKSPLVVWLTDYLRSSGRRPGLVSRGYKAKKQTTIRRRDKINAEESDDFSQYRILNDEAREFEIRFPDVPYFLGRDRVEVANALLKRHSDVDVVILDDAYQHRRIARDLNILVLDALNPFGGRRVVPSGFLREPLSAASRADVVFLNRADLISKNERLAIHDSIASYAPRAIWGELAQRPTAVYRRETSNLKSDHFALQEENYRDWLAKSKTKRIVAFCGLGAPAGFRKTLDAEGIKIASFVEFPDHCAYGVSELKRLSQAVTETNADLLLTTMKDFVKFNGSEKLGAPVFALGIGVQFLSGESDFCAKVQRLF